MSESVSAGTDIAKVGRHLHRTERKTFTDIVLLRIQKRPQRSLTPIQSEENKMIDRLNSDDCYDHSDYNDGLDGEYTDIDYNELRDYFED